MMGIRRFEPIERAAVLGLAIVVGLAATGCVLSDGESTGDASNASTTAETATTTTTPGEPTTPGETTEQEPESGPEAPPTTEPSAASADETEAPTTTVEVAPITLPDVSGSEGLAAASELQDLGFAVIVLDSCSDPSLAGQVVDVTDVDADKTVLVDETGVSEAGLEVMPGGSLEVHVGNGQTCDG